jgi:hypothetical protein
MDVLGGPMPVILKPTEVIMEDGISLIDFG